LPVGRSSQLVVGNPANLPWHERKATHFWPKSAIGTALVKSCAWIVLVIDDPQKGDWTMSGMKFERQLIAAFAALLMSSIAIGAAVAPAQVSATPLEVVTYA
jgi:heme A synthase